MTARDEPTDQRVLNRSRRRAKKASPSEGPGEAFSCRQVHYEKSRGRKPGKIRLGAGDGTRTRDALLGRQVLYQLSYSRVEVCS